MSDPNQMVTELPIGHDWVLTEPTTPGIKSYFHAKWRELHNMDSPNMEKLQKFTASLPTFGCGCAEHFAELIVRIPPPFERDAFSDLAWFCWTYRVRNAVRAILPVPLEPWNYQFALQEWRPHLAWPKQQPTPELVAVTSLAPHRRERQSICLDSWRRLGLKVISVNSPAEIKAMRYDYPVEWISSTDANCKTQRINRLLDVCASEECPTLLINADIEIYGDQSRLLQLVDQRKNAIGIRHNYDLHPGDASIEQWGLDAFLVYPEQIARLTRVDFAIGKPMWDYWLPFELEKIGGDCEWITEPYFFHQSHPVAWSDFECTTAHEAFASQFGPMDWTQWRRSRPI